jgi:Carboxypeptidase regulatory-like domain
MAISIRFVLAVLTLGLSCFGAAGAQIMETPEVGGKTITCMHTGLSSDLNVCGAPDWYAYVFVGTISAITPTKDGEKELHIIPDEVFKGDPANPLIVRTSQGACLPELTVGDRWLYYLRSGNPIVLDFYGNISSPVTDAQQRLETLRRLKTMGDFGLLRGNVMHGPSYSDREPVPGVRVVATRSSDRAKYFTTTDAEGEYEFQPVPVGRYELAAETVGPTYVGDSALKITGGVCWNVTLWGSPAARLSGHIRRSDGSAASKTQVLIMRDDYSWFTTQESDANGYFQEDSLRAGKYVVGISLPGDSPWKTSGCAGACLNEIPPVSLYHPGMLGRSNALVIDLATDEKRDDIDFTLPPQ